MDGNNFPEGVYYEEKTNDNRLLLSLCQQLEGEISRQVISWFQSVYQRATLPAVPRSTKAVEMPSALNTRHKVGIDML